MKSVNGVNGVRLAKLGYACVNGVRPFFPPFFQERFRNAQHYQRFCILSRKKTLAINKEGVDFIGIFFYKGVSSLRERK